MRAASISPSVAVVLVIHTEISHAVLFVYVGPSDVCRGVETTVIDEFDEVAVIRGSRPTGMNIFI